MCKIYALTSSRWVSVAAKELALLQHLKPELISMCRCFPLLKSPPEISRALLSSGLSKLCSKSLPKAKTASLSFYQCLQLKRVFLRE